MTANDLTQYVINELSKEGWIVWKNNAGTCGRHNVRLSPPGVPDIIGCDVWGGFVGIEIKVGADKLRESQIDFFTRVARRPFSTCAVVSSPSQFIAWKEALGATRRQKLSGIRNEADGVWSRRLGMSGVWPAGDDAGACDSADEVQSGEVRAGEDPPSE